METEPFSICVSWSVFRLSHPEHFAVAQMTQNNLLMRDSGAQVIGEKFSKTLRVTMRAASEQIDKARSMFRICVNAGVTFR